MTAGDTLRSLTIDISADASGAIADVEAASGAVDDLEDELRGLLDNAAEAYVALESVGDQAKEVGNEMLLAAGKGQMLQASLSSLSATDVSLPDVGDVGGLGGTDVSQPTARVPDQPTDRDETSDQRTSRKSGIPKELTDIEEQFRTLRKSVGSTGEFEREPAYDSARELQNLLGEKDKGALAGRSREVADYLQGGEQFIAEDQAQNLVDDLGERLEEQELLRETVAEEESRSTTEEKEVEFESRNSIADVVSREVAKGIRDVDFQSLVTSETETTKTSTDVDRDARGGDDVDVGGESKPHLLAEGYGEAQRAALEFTYANLMASDALDEVGDEASDASRPLHRTSRQIDEIGDEAAQATSQLGKMAAALTGIGGGNAQLRLGPLTTSIQNMVLAVATLLPLVTALVASLGGLATALGSVGVVSGGAIAGGMLALGDKVAAETTEAETAMEGVTLVMEEFAKAASEAMAPLKQPMFEDLAVDVLRGALKYLRMFAVFAAETYKELQPVIDAITGAWWDNTPDFFVALHEAAIQLSDEIQSLLVWLADALPKAINFLVDMTQEMWDEMVAIGAVLIDLIGEMIKFGSVILSVVTPAITGLLGAVSSLLEAFNNLPPAAQGFIVALVALQRIISASAIETGLLETVTLGLGHAYTFLTAPTASAIAAIQAFSASAAGATTVTGALSMALRGAAASAWAFVTSPVGMVAIALISIFASLATNAYGVADAFDEFVSSLDWVADIMDAIIPAGMDLLDVLAGIGEIALAPIAIPLRAILEVLTLISNAVDEGLGAGVWSIVTPLRLLGELAGEVVEAGSALLDWYNNLSQVGKAGGLLVLATLFGQVGVAAWTLYEGTQALTGGIYDVTNAVGDTSTFLGSFLTLLVNAAETAVAPLNVVLEDALALFNALSNVVDWAASRYEEFTQSLQNDTVDKALGVLAPIVDGIVGTISDLVDAGGKLAELGLAGLFWLWGINLGMVAANATATAAANLYLAASNSTLLAVLWNIVTLQYAKSAAMGVVKAATVAASAATTVLSGAYGVLTGSILSSTAAVYANVVAEKVSTAWKSAKQVVTYAASAATSVYAAVTWVAAAAEWALLAPILIIVGVLVTAIGLWYAYTENLWGVKDAIDSVIGGLINLGKAIVDGVIGAIKSAIDWLKEWGLELVLGLAGGILLGPGIIASTLFALFSGAMPFDKMIEWGKRIPYLIASGIMNAADVVVGAVEDLLNKAEETWNKHTPDMKSIEEKVEMATVDENVSDSQLGLHAASSKRVDSPAVDSPEPSPEPNTTSRPSPGVGRFPQGSGGTTYDVNVTQQFDNSFGDTDPERAREEIERTSEDGAVEGILGALKTENEGT